MAITLEKETGLLSLAEINHQRKLVEDILVVISSGASVSLEGPPIYLNEPWSRDHDFGYNLLLRFSHAMLSANRTPLFHSVLLDDYTVQSSVDSEDYLSRIKLPIDEVVTEASFVSQAAELMDAIGGRRVNRLDGRPVRLITQSGRVACAILDAAFQESKKTDFSVVIHPIQFKQEQEEMRSILLAARGKLPSTFVNIFFKERSVNKVYITEPEGVSQRVL